MDAREPTASGRQTPTAAGGEDVAQAARALTDAHSGPAQVRAIFGGLSVEKGAELLASLGHPVGRDALLWLPPEQAGAILAIMERPAAAHLLSGLPSDERTDLLALVSEEARSAIQAALPEAARAESAKLLRYPPDTAGGLMETELLSFADEATVRDVIRDLRANQQRYATFPVQYLYVVDTSRRLVGVAPLRDLLLAPEDSRLSTLARAQVTTVRDSATTQQLADLFDEHGYQGLPVVDEAGVLLGTVNRADVAESEQHELEEDYRLSQGIVGGEELRSMPVLLRARRRAAWLGVNLSLSLGGAAIIALQQGTLARALVVASVLPVISASSGNAAMQAAAVSIRELTLGVVGPGSWRRVLWHEGLLAALLALPLGLAVAVLARLWGAGGGIGTAIGVAMAANTMVAVGIGAVCPLALRRLNIDPALASGPITTTIADITGFALTLGLVSLVA